MLVKAKCISLAWDSVNAIQYAPGCGPLPGGLYEIDRNGPLASLKVGRSNVFEFDRNAPPGVMNDYTCKKCGETKDPTGRKFTLNTLGTHTRSAHKDDPHPLAEPDNDEPIVLVDGRKKKGKTFTCKTCGEILPNLYAVRVHNRTHVQPENEIEAETAVPA